MQEFARYLEAKRSVDDRALDRRVLERLRQEVSSTPSLDVADVGAGSGIGTKRLVDWGVLNRPKMTLLDRDPSLVDLARQRLSETSETSEGIDARFVASTLAEFASSPENHESFDLVVAHAVLDDVDLPAGLKDALRLARPGGLVYFPVTFDGHTIFEPEDGEDGLVLARYHETMEVTGHPRTGRRLFAYLREEAVEILAVGSSDWVVYPTNGVYPEDEALFLDRIVGLIASAVGETAKKWCERRNHQIGEGSLVYIAHQLDFLARKLPRRS